MPHRGPLTAVLTAVLGVTFGGVLAWRFYQTKRRRLPSFQRPADPVDAPRRGESAAPCPQPPPPPEKEFKAVECQTQLPPAVQIPTCEQLLAVEPLTVSCEDQWQQLWPQMQKELTRLPVLGLDCEWVKAAGVRSPLLREDCAPLADPAAVSCRRCPPKAKPPPSPCCRWPRTRAAASW